MQDKNCNATFAVDGYEVSATFAGNKNPAALGQIKQILLSSFANNMSNPCPGDILAISSEQRDNKGGDNHRVP